MRKRKASNTVQPYENGRLAHYAMVLMARMSNACQAVPIRQLIGMRKQLVIIALTSKPYGWAVEASFTSLSLHMVSPSLTGCIANHGSKVACAGKECQA